MGFRWWPWAKSEELNLWGGPVRVLPVEYEFEAVVAHIGVPDRDNRVLARPSKNEVRLWAGVFPLPVLPLRGRHVRTDRALPEGPIGKVERLEIDDHGVMRAYGSMYAVESARDHVGALGLRTAWMKAEVQAARQEGGTDRPDGLRLHHWKVLGVSVVDRVGWDATPVKLWPVKPVE